MKRETPLTVGRVRIGLLHWPRRSAQYASWMDTYPTRRPNRWPRWVAIALAVVGAAVLAAEVLRYSLPN